jgi:hypothetical protein
LGQKAKLLLLLLLVSAKLGGKLAVQLCLMDGQIGREGHSSISWSTGPKVLSFSSRLMPLKVPKLLHFCSSYLKM